MSFKNFDLSHDVASLVSSVNEVVAISGSLITNPLNVKFYSNIASGSSDDLGGYFQTIYDSSPTGSLSTALLDITFGYATGSHWRISATASSSINEKVKVYRQFAAQLLGDPDAIFEKDGTPFKEAFFITLKRNIQKDEIKKGSVSFITHDNAAYYTSSDAGAVTSFKQTVGGDFGQLNFAIIGSQGTVWYNAGVLMIDATFWDSPSTIPVWSGTKNISELMYSGSINNLVDGFRNFIDRVDFHNQTNLYSTVYFCRATNTEFNYSSNPTFVDDNKRIRVTSGSNILQTRSYVTTIGLYDSNDNLLAVAKVNKPITKSPDNEAIFRIRLDF